MIDFGAGKKLSTPTTAFEEIVGQEALKEALLAVGSNDELGGLLVRGEKGTAKSTAVRALVECLPEQRVIADCPYGCGPDDSDKQCSDCRSRSAPPVETRPVPLVTLPIGATRDRVVGTLSVGDVLEGTESFDPGLLARANRGILYVDEVNLLEDHLVDVLLDAAASGVNRVERDGVSLTHPADVTLVGTMNPEEGDLRPQLRDRFALQATVTGCDDLDDRVAIIDHALGTDTSDSDQTGDKTVEDRASDVSTRLERARGLLTDGDGDRDGDVTLPDEFKREIATLCREAGVDGHRADIATARAARTFAALDGRPNVLESDVRRAAELALPHRMQSDPFADAPDAEEIIDDHFEDESADNGDSEPADDDRADEAADDEQTDGTAGEGERDSGGDGDSDGDGGGDGSRNGAGTESGDTENSDTGNGDTPVPRPDDNTGESTNRPGDESRDGSDGDGSSTARDDTEPGTPIVPGAARAGIGDGTAPNIEPSSVVADSCDGNRVSSMATADGDGPRVRTERASTDDQIDAAASVRAAASRGSDTVTARDLRNSIRADTSGALVVFAIDASASMRPAMRTAKGVAIDLLRDAYEHRDEVAVVTFAGDDADVVLPPTDSVPLAARHLKDLPTADCTPLPDGLDTAADVLARADPAVGVVVLVTDGRANSGADSPTAATRTAAKRLANQEAHVIVVDTEPTTDRASLAGDITTLTDGDRIPLDSLTPDHVDRTAGLADDHN